MDLFSKLFKKQQIKEDKKSEKIEKFELYNIKFPFFIEVYKENFSEENGDEPIEIKGNEAFNYLNKDDIEGICYDFESSKLYQYCDNLCGKIADMKMEFSEDGYVKIIVYSKEELSEENKKILIKFISGQMSDGWGEGNFDYENEKNEKYSVRFWKYNNWDIFFI